MSPALLAALILLSVTPGVLLQETGFEQILDDALSLLQLPEDVGLNISEYLTKYHYPFEAHEVPTDDGFVLGLHRINHKESSPETVEKPAVLLLHCLVCSGADWVFHWPNSSLALLLADEGYDVWLMNFRGSEYSTSHRKYNSSQKEYWDFSFHEKGYYDLSASIDYILNVTGLEKISIVAHSEGTSATMALTSTRPEYNDKLNLLMFLSPVGYMDGVRSHIPLLLAKYMPEIEFICNALHIYGIPYSKTLSKLISFMCSVDGITEICGDVLQYVGGYDPYQVDLSRMAMFVSEKPNGLAIKQVLHYGQEMNSGYFRQYDYGLIGNMEKYGSMKPPSYNVSTITAPVVAFYGQNDYLSAPEDVEKLTEQMPNVKRHLIDYEYFNHLDFLYAKDVKTLVYDRCISIVKSYNPL